ncbi:major coat protein [Variovorax sp. V116]|uniref:major coat protein n=1 Tax=Variovorax sp. V116 TaxID=3065953 RepID=UPI0034E8A4B8
MNKRFAQIAAGAAGLAGSVSAFAVDPATGLEAVSSLSGSSTGYGPVMFGLAVTVVGIMIGVKWIKRARGAA